MLLPCTQVPIYQPAGPQYFTIFGVDPGTVTFGTAAMHVDIQTLQVVGLEMRTLNANKPSGGRMRNEWMLETHSERAMRMRELAWMLGSQLEYFRPLYVASEAAFYDGLHPNAYGPLVECVKTVENTVYAWNAWRPLFRIETTVAKAAIAPETKELKQEFKELSKSKALPTSKAKVLWCALRHSEFSKIIASVPFDEHSLDAAVIAYAQLLRIRQGNFEITF